MMKSVPKAVSIFVASLIAITQFSFLTFADSESEYPISIDCMEDVSTATNFQNGVKQEDEEVAQISNIDPGVNAEDSQESTLKQEDDSLLLEEEQTSQEDVTDNKTDSTIREGKKQDANELSSAKTALQEQAMEETCNDSASIETLETQKMNPASEETVGKAVNNTYPTLTVDISGLSDMADPDSIKIYGNIILLKGYNSGFAVLKADGSILSDFSYISYEFPRYKEYSDHCINNKYPQPYYTLGQEYYQLMLLKRDNLIYPLNTLTGELSTQGFSSVDYFVNDLATVQSGEKYGVINIDGKVVLEPVYTQITISDGIILAIDEVSSYYFDAQGKNITPTGFIANFSFGSGVGLTGFADGLGPVMSTTTYKAGFIDKKGNFIIDPEYDIVGYEVAGPQRVGFINGYTLAVDDTQIAYIDIGGTVYDFNPVVREIVENYNDGVFIPEHLSEWVDRQFFSWPVNDKVLIGYQSPNLGYMWQYYLCDIKTAKVTPMPQITGVEQVINQSKQVMAVTTVDGPNFVTPDGQLQITDGHLSGCKRGAPVTFANIELPDFEVASRLTELKNNIDGLYFISDNSTSLQGLYNAITGNYLPCEYDKIRFTASGIILTKGGRTGFYNYQLQETIPCEYDVISTFQYIGEQNKSSFDLSQYLQARKNNEYTVFSVDGKKVLSGESSFHWMDYDRFSDTLQTYPYSTAVYTKEGEKIIELGVDAENVADAFCNGVLLAWQGEKYGAFDIDGNLIVPMEYDELSHFNAGYAAGKKKGNFSTSVPEVFDILNSKGEVIYSESTMYPSSYAMEVSSQHAVYCGLGDFKIITLPEAETAPEGSIALDQTQLSLYVGNVKTLVASTDPLSASIDWSSENPNIAKVDNNGQVTAVSEGTTTITASITVNQKRYEASCVITVKEHIKFTDKEIQLTIKSSKKLNVKVDPTDMSVTWKSNAPDVVSVDNNGVVTGISQGSATITATVLVNGAPYSDSCTITVGAYLDLSQYFINMKDFKLGMKVLDNWPEDSTAEEKKALLLSLLKNESVTEEIEGKLYNLLFNAQYRPNVFGGDNSRYPTQNEGEHTDRLFDSNLKKTMIFKTSDGGKRTCAGCMHYANSAMVYLYGKPEKSNIIGWIEMRTNYLDKKNGIKNAENVKKYLERAVPGSHIRFEYSVGSAHSVVFLGKDDLNKGFYYISFLGGGSHPTTMYVGYTTYEKIANQANFVDVVTIKNSVDSDYNNHLKKIKGTAHCPIDISISYGNETLNSSTNQLSASFGAMTIQEIEGERSVSFEIDYGYEYNIVINGTGTGEMDLTVEFLDENENTFGRVRKFYAVPITAQTKGWLSKMDVELPTELILYEGEQFKEVWAASDQDIADGPNEYYTNLYQSQLPPETQEPEEPNGSQNQNPPSTDNTGSVDNVTGIGNAATENNEGSTNSSGSSNKPDETSNSENATSDKEQTQENQDTAASSGAESAVTENDQLVPSQENEPTAASSENGNGLIWLFGAIVVIGILAAVIIIVVRRKNESDE